MASDAPPRTGPRAQYPRVKVTVGAIKADVRLAMEDGTSVPFFVEDVYLQPYATGQRRGAVLVLREVLVEEMRP